MSNSTYFTLKNSDIFKKIIGMTLIELMFVLALTLFIISGVSSIYLASVKNHVAETALQNIQQNARITFQQLNTVLRSAGYIGCSKLTDDFPIYSSTSYNITKENRIQSYQGNELKSGTDAFTVRYANAINANLIETMKVPDVLHVTASPKITAGDVLLISDCKTADIFTVEQVSIESDGTQMIKADDALSKCYEIYAEVSALEINTFYIGKTDRKDLAGLPVYALYQKDKYSHKTELVEGVNGMQIQYFIEENGNIFEEKIPTVNQWNAVVGISLQLNFSSLNRFPLQKTEYHVIAFREP
jgi:type IV pilus assembly protein PilW